MEANPATTETEPDMIEDSPKETIESRGVLLGREHLLAASFAPKDRTNRWPSERYSGLHIKADGAVEATNGHYAISVPASRLPVENFPAVASMGGPFNGDGLILPVAVCLDALKAIKGPITAAHVGVTESKDAVITTTDGAASSSRGVTPIKAEFPNVAQFTRGDDDGRMVVGFDPQYLRDIADYAVKVMGKDATIALSIVADPKEAANVAARFDVTLPDGRVARIALMPKRV